MPLEAVGRRSGDRRVFENTTVRPITFLLIFAVLLPVIAAFGILYRRSLSVPYQDDYDTIIAFGVHYAQSPTLKAKLLEIAAEQHNEYKLGFEHSIVAAELELTHHLNFTFLTVLGDLFLLPLGYLLWRTYQPDESGLDRRLLAFLPISLLFFSLTYWENLNWATTGLQNTPVILFSLLAISLIAPGKTALYCSSAAWLPGGCAGGVYFGEWFSVRARGSMDPTGSPRLWRICGMVRQLHPAARRLPLPLHTFFTWCIDSSTSPGRSFSRLFGLCGAVPLGCSPVGPGLMSIFVWAVRSLRSNQSRCVLLRRLDRGHGRPGRMGAGRGNAS